MAEAKLAAAFENISVFSVNENELFFFFIANISSKIQKFECFFFHYHKKQPRFYGISCLNPPQSTPDKLKEMLILRISLSERRSLQQLLEIKTISTTSSFTDPVRQYDF